MTELQPPTPTDVPTTLRRVLVAAPQASGGGPVEPGVVLVPELVDGVVEMKLLESTGERLPVDVAHAASGQALTWAELAVSTREAAVSGWYPGKLGGWVKLDWRDGGFAADAWSSDGAGMTAYDVAMRAAARRS